MFSEKLHLDKWFLDFESDDGRVIIVYAAKLTWRGIVVPYTSLMTYRPAGQAVWRSRFSRVHMPVRQGPQITWRDPQFGLSGIWKAEANCLQARLYDSEDGYLDWNCYQPASRVRLAIEGEEYEGRGYAEQLILTVPPWKIPMHELRWGRFLAEGQQVVWIEIREKEKRQWLWINGEQKGTCDIEDDHLAGLQGEFRLHLDNGVVLEAEKKIQSVVGKILRFIPGFQTAIPLRFLLADECKWLSRGVLDQDSKACEGRAIHEYVDFNTPFS